MKILITEEHHGKRLDHVIKEYFPDRSRSALQKWVKDGRVRVNGKEVAPHHFLKKRDEISVEEAKDTEQKTPSEVLPPLTIVAETDEFLVIDKPSGVVVHPGILHESGTLVDTLRVKYPFIGGVGDDPQRPGIVHRLDKDASGLMVIAKNQDSFDSLKSQFKTRAIKKQYMIVTSGRVEPREGVIDIPLRRSRRQFIKYVASPNEGKPAETHYAVVQYLKNASIVWVEPRTGRTHQIRVHFFAKGNPVLGDTIYVSKGIKQPSVPRLMLHACVLGFKDISGNVCEYTSPIPDDFQKVLTTIDKSARISYY